VIALRASSRLHLGPRATCRRRPQLVRLPYGLPIYDVLKEWRKHGEAPAEYDSSELRRCACSHDGIPVRAIHRALHCLESVIQADYARDTCSENHCQYGLKLLTTGKT
jgi:hypothetical protein